MATDIEVLAFRQLMTTMESILNQRALDDVPRFKRMTPSELEFETLQAIKDACDNSVFNKEDVRLVSGMRFPDIMVGRFFGVEVKSTNKDHWTSTGSSIVETTRDKDVECIYMLFGKLGGDVPEFRCRPYHEVLSEIAVTHSPRYRIDMSLNAGETIFDKMGISYDSLRTSGDSIGSVRDYYKEKAKREGNPMPWWISDDKADDSSVDMSIKSWHSLPANDKSLLVAQSLVLFPEVIYGDYANAAMWLVSVKGVVCANMRDPFSAGGKIRKLNDSLLEEPLPHIVKTLLDKYQIILRLLESDKDFRDQIASFNPELLGNPLKNWLNQAQTALERVDVRIPIVDLLNSQI
jgi:hypothetical protein